MFLRCDCTFCIAHCNEKKREETNARPRLYFTKFAFIFSLLNNNNKWHARVCIRSIKWMLWNECEDQHNGIRLKATKQTLIFVCARARECWCWYCMSNVCKKKEHYPTRHMQPILHAIRMYVYDVWPHACAVLLKEINV